MLTYLPKYFTQRAILCYFIALLTVSVFFFNYAMYWYWWVFGITEVFGFFWGSNFLTKKWAYKSSQQFTKSLFSLALVLRLCAVFFLYWFFDFMTGQPFMFSAADSLGYHGEAEWFASEYHYGSLQTYWLYLLAKGGVSDWGYPIWLGIQYVITSNSIIIARIIKALLGAWTCVLIYKLAGRNFSEPVARMSAIFCVLMPNLIVYCGMHLKEIEMVFLMVLAVERMDYVMHSSKLPILALIISLICIALTFFFRTALGAVLLLALLISLMISPSGKVNLWKKIVVGGVVAFGLSLSVGDKLIRETEDLWNAKGENQSTGMQWYSNRKGGNKFAKYASSTVFAPLIFTIPFSTMVETSGQENQRLIHGGNFVKNVTSSFTLFALILLLMRWEWRRYLFPLAVMGGYLIVIAFSAFAQSERFHLPALPLSLMFAAYGVSNLEPKHRKFFNFWLIFVFVANVGWAWFKLKGRGL